MSSDYGLFCLSHDPAILAADGMDLAEAERVATAGLAHHEGCNILIGRWSGALIEIGCPARKPQPHCGWHAETKWIDRDLLRIVALARHDDDTQPSVQLTEALERLDSRCWTHARTYRLRAVLEVDR